MPGADDDPAGGSGGLDALVPVPAAEFPVYFFATQPTWDGVSLAAQARNGAARPGVYAVITSDPEEMRQALREGGH